MKYESKKELNETMWWRIVKVIFVGIVLYGLMFVIVGPYMYFNPGEKLVTEKTTVNCKHAGEYTIKEINDSPDHYLYVYNNKDLKGEGEGIEGFCKDASMFFSSDTPSEKMDRILYPGEFTVDKHYYNWGYVIGSTIVALAAYFLVIDIIRRIIYYILLGKFFPK